MGTNNSGGTRQRHSDCVRSCSTPTWREARRATIPWCTIPGRTETSTTTWRQFALEGFDRGWCYLDKVMLDFSYVPAWRVWTLGCRPPRVVARQNDAESANSIEESRPRDAEQDRGPGQLPVRLLKSSEDVGAFRVS